jgi:hypothetical protein
MWNGAGGGTDAGRICALPVPPDAAMSAKARNAAARTITVR